MIHPTSLSPNNNNNSFSSPSSITKLKNNKNNNNSFLFFFVFSLKSLKSLLFLLLLVIRREWFSVAAAGNLGFCSFVSPGSIMETTTISFSFPTISVFFPMFLVIYLLAYFGVFRNWNPKYRPEASSCLISLAHGTPAVFLAIFAIAGAQSQSQRGFATPNTNFQNMVLEFSIAYFLMDLLHYFIFTPTDILFIGHHLATLFVFVTCRYVVFHGAFAILVLLALAEVTSACQNTWTLANARKTDVPTAAKLYELLCPPFYAFYSVVRGLAGPLFVYEMGVFYLSGAADNVIPRWLSVSWVIVVVLAISLSILWISNLWLELYRERTGKLEKKLR